MTIIILSDKYKMSYHVFSYVGSPESFHKTLQASNA